MGEFSTIGTGPTVSQHGKLADVVFNAVGLQLFFGFPDVGNLWMRVDDARDHIIVDMPDLPGHVLSHGGTLVLAKEQHMRTSPIAALRSCLGLVGKHWSRHTITNGVDARNIGLPVLVDLNEATFVHLDTERVQTETLRVRTSPDRHQHRLRLQRRFLATLDGLDFDCGAVAALVGA